MAKQAAYSKAFEEMFNRLLTNAGSVLPGTEQMESIRGTKREQWAFPEGQMNPVNVTPFQDRSLDEQKALGLVLSQLYGSGSHYESAEAMKSQAAVGHEKNRMDQKLFDMFEKDKQAKANAEAAGGGEGYTPVEAPSGSASAAEHRVNTPPPAPKTSWYDPPPDADVSGIYSGAATPAAPAGVMSDAAYNEMIARKKKKPAQQSQQKQSSGDLWNDGGYSNFLNRR
jgi:hypothetical protein